jgi:hypothetical protein
MSRFRTLFEWAIILVPLIIIGFLVFAFVAGYGLPAAQPSGLPGGTGGFFQSTVSPPQVFEKTSGNWHFTLTSAYAYTLAGRVVGRHEYPDLLPDGVIPLDLAVVNGDLIRTDILSFFTFRMGYHTLEYSYDIPTMTGLTESYIDEHISNNHLVFLNTTLENEVKGVREGNCVIIRGNLVDIRGISPEKLYIINTSTVRNDTYPAGCEIVLVSSYTPVSCGDQA